MGVPKRLRFEVFRRDGFRCRYCGATPDQKQLRPDHVIPEVLGGRTEPANLVTACEDCNSGKSSVLLTGTIADVDEHTAPNLAGELLNLISSHLGDGYINWRAHEVVQEAVPPLLQLEECARRVIADLAEDAAHLQAITRRAALTRSVAAGIDKSGARLDHWVYDELVHAVVDGIYNSSAPSLEAAR